MHTLQATLCSWSPRTFCRGSISLGSSLLAALAHEEVAEIPIHKFFVSYEIRGGLKVSPRHEPESVVHDALWDWGHCENDSDTLFSSPLPVAMLVTSGDHSAVCTRGPRSPPHIYNRLVRFYGWWSALWILLLGSCPSPITPTNPKFRRALSLDDE